MDSAYFSRFIHHDIAVFWDIEDSKIPDGYTADMVVTNIKSALNRSRCLGTVTSIKAYDNTYPILVQLLSAGVTPVHVPEPQVQWNRRNHIRDGLLNWAVNHCNDETNVLLILGDLSRDYHFIRSLFFMKRKNFNFVLSLPPGATGPLLADGALLWYWDCLLAGEAPMPNSELKRLRRLNVEFEGYCSSDDDET